MTDGPFRQPDGSYHIVLDRWEYVGRNGAYVGYSDQYPGRKFLVVPQLGFQEVGADDESHGG
jgi:hypothetical protein